MFRVAFDDGRFSETSDIACATGLFEERRQRAASLFCRDVRRKIFLRRLFGEGEVCFQRGCDESEMYRTEHASKASVQCGGRRMTGDKSGRSGKNGRLPVHDGGKTRTGRSRVRERRIARTFGMGGGMPLRDRMAPAMPERVRGRRRPEDGGRRCEAQALPDIHPGASFVLGRPQKGGGLF